MRSIIFLGFIAVVVLVGCNSAKKIIAPTAKSEALSTLISKQSFRIESDWAYPLTTTSLMSIANSRLLPPGSNVSRISLIGNPNYLKIRGDSITMYLPYYGERQMAGQYNPTQSGIVFEGIPYRYEVIKDEKKQQHLIKFSVKAKNESYNVILTLFPNWNSRITVNSSHRTSIQYSGTVSVLETDLPVAITQ